MFWGNPNVLPEPLYQEEMNRRNMEPTDDVIGSFTMNIQQIAVIFDPDAGFVFMEHSQKLFLLDTLHQTMNVLKCLKAFVFEVVVMT